MRRLLKTVGVAYGIYLMLSLLVILPLLNILPPRLVKEQLHRELRAELILFNPFTLALEARNTELLEHDGHRPLAFRQLLINFSLASLWEPGIVLDEFRITDLDVHVLRYKSGEFHFADLLASDDEPAPPPSDSPVPGVTVRELLIDAHTITFTDRTRPGGFSTVQRDFALQTRNLTTVPDRQGNGELELIGDGGGRVRWRGELDLAAGISHGELQLDQLDLTHAWRYRAEDLAFVANSARFDAVLKYNANWSEEFALTLGDSSLRLHTVDLYPKDHASLPDTHIGLGELTVDGMAFDLAAQTLEINAVNLRGIDVAGFDEGDTISLERMFVTADPENGPDSPEASQGASVESGTDDEWQITVARVSLEENQLAWRTTYLEPEVMTISPLRASFTNLQWPAQSPSSFEGELAINELSRVTTSGAMNLGSGDGELELRLESWPLPWINPIVHQQAHTDLRRGSLEIHTRLQTEAFAPESARIDLTVNDFATELHDTGEEAFSLASLKVNNTTLDFPQQIARVESIVLQRPAGSLHIREDGSININGIVRQSPDTEDTTEGVEEDNGTEEGMTNEEEESWRVILSSLQLQDGRLDFADNSLPLPFRTLIADIQANIRDLDSASAKPLSLEFNGSVDGYAPVVIEGRGSPLADQQDGELRLSFRGVDIATMSPYSGTYAGYTIDSGSLTLDLRYALEGQQLDGQNHIVISQMKLGEPVESDLAVEVPLKLGLALLTDSAGVIDLSVPVSGDVDDPQFSLGSIIGKALMNVLVKAVTAPFKLLAGLAGSEADLENIPFAPGKTTLDETGTASLTALANALQQRPQLQLGIAGGAAPQADGALIREELLTQALVDEGLGIDAITSRNEEFHAAITRRFQALPTSASTDSEGEAAPLPDLEGQRQAVLASIAVPAARLRDLGTERAATAKRELVTVGGIDAARIVISYDETLLVAGVKMELGN